MKDREDGEMNTQKRAVLYARVSGDDRKYATSGIESQLSDCREYAQNRGYRIVGEHYETPDKATSGADWLPEIERVLTLAQDGAYDVLVVREIDRLARNRFKQMAVEIELEAQGVAVEYVIGQYEDSAEGRLLKGLMGEFAEYEREKTIERTKRGSIRSVSAGNVIIGGSYAPFGYDVEEVDGKRTLTVNEREAEIVRLIFNRYAYEGESILGMCRYLKEHNVPTPTKGSPHRERRTRHGWSTGTMSGILNNETYVGRWYYRKTKQVKGRDGKKRAVARPRSEWLLIEVPAIIDEETFQLVQRRRKENKRRRQRRKHYPYPLGGSMKCGRCGASMVGITRRYKNTPHRYYRCATKHSAARYERNCDMPTLRTEEIDELIWSWVKNILFDPAKLREAWENHERQLRQDMEPLINMIETNEARLAALQDEKQRLIKAYAAGALTLDDIAEEKTRVEEQITNVSQAIEALQADLAPRMPNPDQLETIGSYVARIGKGAELAGDEPETQREIYRLIQLEVTLSYKEAEDENNEGQHWVDFQCTLGEDRLSTGFTTSRRSVVGRASGRAGAL